MQEIRLLNRKIIGISMITAENKDNREIRVCSRTRIKLDWSAARQALTIQENHSSRTDSLV